MLKQESPKEQGNLADVANLRWDGSEVCQFTKCVTLTKPCPVIADIWGMQITPKVKLGVSGSN